MEEASKPATPPGAADQPSEGSEVRPALGPGGACLTPELRAWALQQFTEEEIVAGLQELREKGGLEFREFVQELEQVLHDSERAER